MTCRSCSVPLPEHVGGKSSAASYCRRSGVKAVAVRNIVLIVCDRMPDDVINKMIHADGYEVKPAAAAESLSKLAALSNRIAAVILDMASPSREGAEFLDSYAEVPAYRRIPLFVVSGDDSQDEEQRCLERGAWDFVGRGHPKEVIRKRIVNMIEHSTLPLIEALKKVSELAPVSDIYNKSHFFGCTRAMIDANRQSTFAMLCLDVEKFRLINSFFGLQEGDELIRFIAGLLRGLAAQRELFTYGDLGAAVFAFCTAFEKKEELEELARYLNGRLRGYPLAFDLSPAIGIAIAEDHLRPVNALLDEASLACRLCKGNYLRQYEFYSAEMEENAVREQRVVNSMEAALANEDFTLYLQPKYDIANNRVDGAEVLVRWLDKERGVIKPNDFIPIFERNGFITKLDYYVWDHACAMLRRWLDSGRKVCPISVNISRVNLYNPRLAEVICGLVEKYALPAELLQLELTESAYANIPELMRGTMKRLRDYGFTLLMDDFGSGYSSLNMLKDITVNVLKIDMRFLSECDTPGRGENILDSILRMAKWLDMQVLVEGVETLDQVTFLRNIGCEYVQGYYFAEPMPACEFEKKVLDSAFVAPDSQRRAETQVEISSDMIWSAASQLEKLFSNVMQAVALYEFDGLDIEVLRVNDAYTSAFGHGDLLGAPGSFMKDILPEDRLGVSKVFEALADLRGADECDFRRLAAGGRVIWVHAMFKYVKTIATKTVVLASLYDVTVQKRLEQELQNYRAAVAASRRGRSCVLVIDDVELDRSILAGIFKGEYTVLEADSAEQGLEILRAGDRNIDVVLLDLMMPGMSGLSFLEELRKDEALANIPVVVATVNASPNMQNKMLEIGARDYILKPFVPAVVFRRVSNVLESARRYGQSLSGAES